MTALLKAEPISRTPPSGGKRSRPDPATPRQDPAWERLPEDDSTKVVGPTERQKAKKESGNAGNGLQSR